MPSNAEREDNWKNEEEMKRIANILPFLHNIHDDEAITFESSDGAKLLAKLIDDIPTPRNQNKYTNKLKVIHRAIMLFGNIANDYFLPSKASKLLIARKVGCEMKQITCYLGNRNHQNVLERLSVQAGEYSIRVDTASLTIVAPAEYYGGEEGTRTITLTRPANEIATAFLKMIKTSNTASTPHRFEPSMVATKQITEETKASPLPVTRCFQKSHDSAGEALTEVLTNKGELPLKHEHHRTRGRASTQVKGGVLANMFLKNTDLSGNTRSRKRLIHHDESMPRTANNPAHSFESTYRFRKHSGTPRLSRLPVGTVFIETRPKAESQTTMSEDSLCHSSDSPAPPSPLCSSVNVESNRDVDDKARVIFSPSLSTSDYRVESVENSSTNRQGCVGDMDNEDIDFLTRNNLRVNGSKMKSKEEKMDVNEDISVDEDMEVGFPREETRLAGLAQATNTPTEGGGTGGNGVVSKSPVRLSNPPRSILRVPPHDRTQKKNVRWEGIET